MSNVTKHCPFCGSAVEQGSVFCQNCGASLTDVEETTPAPQYYQPPPQQQPQDQYQYNTATQQQSTTVIVGQEPRKDDQGATTALIFAILGWFCCPGIFSLVAVILGHRAYSQTKSSTALIALILGYIVLIGGIISIIYYVFIWGFF